MFKNISLTILMALAFVAGIYFGPKLNLFDKIKPFSSPFVSNNTVERPLQKYSIENLSDYNFQANPIILEKIIETNDNYTSFVFTYETTGKKMSGQINLPHNSQNITKTILMLRGYVPVETYETGTGTKNAAAVFAQNGMVTVAPDFFGVGLSEPEPEDPWEARLIKPINAIELIESLKLSQLQASLQLEKNLEYQKLNLNLKNYNLTNNQINIWAHSNGGQIALTTLEILEENIPTTLWAPVTAPFPYSILFFTDEMEDEGKATRAWLSMFEKTYDVFDFSLTKHLNKLTGTIQIHHGNLDEAAPISWSREFIEKIKKENKARDNASDEFNFLSEELEATSEIQAKPSLPPIELIYYEYPGADHNLQPKDNWNLAINRDLEFFEKN